MQQTIRHLVDIAKNVIDVISASTITAAFFGFFSLPNLVYLATLLWTVLRIYEMKTVQNFLNKKRRRKKSDTTE